MPNTFAHAGHDHSQEEMHASLTTDYVDQPTVSTFSPLPVYGGGAIAVLVVFAVVFVYYRNTKRKKSAARPGKR